jgi:hypothetical protein
MKPKVKKELERSRLADAVGAVLVKARPYSNYILAVAVILAAAYLFSQYTSGRAQATNQGAWSALYAGLAKTEMQGGAEALSQVADEFPDEPAAALAMAQTGCLQLGEGSKQFYSDPQKSTLYLEKAERYFKKVIEQFSKDDHSMAVQTAMWGLAFVYETRGDLAGATRQFKSVVEQYPGTAIAENAQRRLTALAEPGAAEFYASAATQAKAAATQAKAAAATQAANTEAAANATLK